MLFNQDDEIPIKSNNGKQLTTVKNFKYLGGWMMSTEKDFEVRKALAWAACYKLSKIWSSNIRRNIKERLFLSAIEPILLYGAEAWTVTKSLRKRLDGCYTRMLRMVFNVSWKDKVRNEDLYGRLPPASSKVASRRLKLAGHCARHLDEVASKLVLWEPSQGRMNIGRRAVTYVDVMKEDTGLETTEELKTAMMERNGWRQRADLARARARPK